MITRSAFRPAWWLPGPHLQTLYPSLLRTRKIPALTRERIELPDGDFLDLDWTGQTDGLIVLILHGLEGSIASHYTGGMLSTLAGDGHTAGPVLLLQARDDPFLPESALPLATELGHSVTLELSPGGGHVGFVSGRNPLRPVYWLEQRVLQHLAAYRQ